MCSFSWTTWKWYELFQDVPDLPWSQTIAPGVQHHQLKHSSAPFVGSLLQAAGGRGEMLALDWRTHEMAFRAQGINQLQDCNIQEKKKGKTRWEVDLQICVLEMKHSCRSYHLTADDSSVSKFTCLFTCLIPISLKRPDRLPFYLSLFFYFINFSPVQRENNSFPLLYRGDGVMWG